MSSCTFENKTHAAGASFISGCDTCACGNDGRVTCKPRCPAAQMPDSHPLCFKVPDRQDPCCTMLVCDVEKEQTGEYNMFERWNRVSPKASIVKSKDQF